MASSKAFHASQAQVRVVAPLAELVERVYAPETDGHAWLTRMHEIASSAFEGHLGAVAFLARITRERVEIEPPVGDPVLAEGMTQAHRFADARLSAIYRSGVVSRASQHMPPSDPHRAFETAKAHGVPDALGVVGVAHGVHACVLCYLLPSPASPLSRTARVALARVAAHMGAAYRLRGAADLDVRAQIGSASAVLSPKGALLDARDEHAKDAAGRARLKEAAAGMLRAKRESRSEPDGLAFWTAMVGGRWTLVERFDTDGKRLLIARRNAPRAAEQGGLDERERSVLERASLGSPLSHIAYELGLPASTASETLARAMRKLGIANRAELVELRASIVGSDEGED